MPRARSQARRAYCEQIEAETLGTTHSLANFGHIRDMQIDQIDQIGKGLDPVLVVGGGFLAEVDFALYPARPHFGILADQELSLR